MTQFKHPHHLSFGLLLLLVGIVFLLSAPGASLSDRPIPAAALPVYTTAYHLPLPEQGGESNPDNPLAFIRQHGPTWATPGTEITYVIDLANYEAMTRTFHLTDTVPLALTFLPDSTRDLAYNPETRQLTWQGDIPPGHLDYLIEPALLTLPYLDLATFGAPNLCTDLIATHGDCDTATVTLNLGLNGYHFPFYGQTWQSLTLSPDGLIFIGTPGTGGPNQWLPNPQPPGSLLAPLWYDADMTHSGRWHAAVLQGFITDYDLLYVQWHNAPHAAFPDVTARYAAALLLGDGPLSGHSFFIYDNIANPMALVQAGYTIGVEDYPGQRGLTYAFAPASGDTQPPQGYPPAAGTTLHLRPVIYGHDYSRSFTYTVQVGGQIPQTIANTAEVMTHSPDPFLRYGWSTHYLYLRHLTFLPVAVGGDQ